MSDRRSSDASSASIEVSLFLNGDSFVGRELARRVLLLSMGHVVSIGDDDDGDGCTARVVQELQDGQRRPRRSSEQSNVAKWSH